MSDLGTLVIACAIRASAVAVVAVLLILITSRRSAALGAAVAGLSIAVLFLVGALSFVPFQLEWTARNTNGVDHPRLRFAAMRTLGGADATATSESSPDGARSEGWAFSSELLEHGWNVIASSLTRRPRHGAHWLSWIGGIFVVGMTLSVFRLCSALWTARQWRHQSQAIDDPALVDRLEALREAMNAPAFIELRETKELKTAATVGWLRLLILLPATWRTWSQGELQAVLAHELSHVIRRDFLYGVLGQLCASLHFYHPMVFWLVRRLRLQQELAADALGARFAGGRGPYLVALASLALRQDDRYQGWLARAFLPAHGTLMRRILMLRNKDVMLGRSGSRCLRYTAAIVLVALGLSVSAVRGPAQDAAPERDDQIKPPTIEAKSAKESRAFDLSYAPADAIGLWAMRPGLLLQKPKLQKVADMINLELPLAVALGPDAGIKFPKLGFRVQDIDEVLGGIHYRYDPKLPEGRQQSIMAGVSKVRMLHPFDWKAAFTQLGADLEEARHAGVTYYRAKNKVFQFYGKNTAFFTPDDRTLVINTEVGIKDMLTRGPEFRPSYIWAEEWSRFEDWPFGMTVTFNEPSMKRLDDKNDSSAQFVRSATRAVAKIDLRDCLAFDACVTCEAESVAKALIDMLRAEIRDEIKRQAEQGSGKSDKALARWQPVGRDFLEKMAIHQEGKIIRFNRSLPIEVDVLIADLFADVSSRDK